MTAALEVMYREIKTVIKWRVKKIDETCLDNSWEIIASAGCAEECAW